MAALTQALVLNPMPTLPVGFPLSSMSQFPLTKGYWTDAPHDKLAV